MEGFIYIYIGRGVIDRHAKILGSHQLTLFDLVTLGPFCEVVPGEDGLKVGPYTHIGERCSVKAFSIGEEVWIGEGCEVGEGAEIGSSQG
jgi:carbonic anhydrase/acetyltransferase-like protein (isoleucine patch superfamily)